MRRFMKFSFFGPYGPISEQIWANFVIFCRKSARTGQKMKISKIATYSLSLKTNVPEAKKKNVKILDFGQKITRYLH